MFIDLPEYDIVIPGELFPVDLYTPPLREQRGRAKGEKHSACR
jgi:hypothetical protein